MKGGGKLATKFNANPPLALKQMKMPCPLPGYAIRLLHDSSTITNKLYKIMPKALHRPKFISYLKLKNNWIESTFQGVHWDAHERAFTSHTRNNQIMIAKLIYKLVNINLMNHKFYDFAQAVRTLTKHFNISDLATLKDRQKPEEASSVLYKQT
jgi:hypothetical protein